MNEKGWPAEDILLWIGIANDRADWLDKKKLTALAGYAILCPYQEDFKKSNAWEL